MLGIVLLIPLRKGKWRKGGPEYLKREERRGLAQKFNEDEQVLCCGMVRIQRVEAPGAGQCCRPRRGGGGDWTGDCKLATATWPEQGAGEMMGDTLPAYKKCEVTVATVDTGCSVAVG